MNLRTQYLVAVAVLLYAIVLAGGCRPGDWRQPPTAPATIAEFERELDRLRTRNRIPGMSAAIAQGDSVVWTRGFGWADREREVRAGPESVYHLASLTKPFASTVLLQLVEEGRLDLDAPVSRFDVELDNATEVRVWHLLSHTASPPPGKRYRYDGYAFAELGKVIQGVTGRSFAEELADRVIRPLELRHTAPNPHDARNALAASGLNPAPIQRNLVREYAPAWGRRVWPSGLFGPIRPMDYPTAFHTSAGLVASAPDVARFSIALDRGDLLSDSIRSMAMRPIVNPAGDTLPYGLGWFVQQHRGVTLVWHYGQWFSSSALIVKVPERQLTFVLLANSDGLSRLRRLGDHGNLLRSPYAAAFLDTFVFGNARLASDTRSPE